VRSLIVRRIEADPAPADTRLIRQALMPTQEVVEVKNGKKVTVERKLYPGYVLVEMVWNQETAHIINSIRGHRSCITAWTQLVGVERWRFRQDEANRC
jgi:transcriptional antiterminator NusG